MLVLDERAESFPKRIERMRRRCVDGPGERVREQLRFESADEAWLEAVPCRGWPHVRWEASAYKLKTSPDGLYVGTTSHQGAASAVGLLRELYARRVEEWWRERALRDGEIVWGGPVRRIVVDGLGVWCGLYYRPNPVNPGARWCAAVDVLTHGGMVTEGFSSRDALAEGALEGARYRLAQIQKRENERGS